MMKFNKKGQAALEFLTTYGWAFLVILVMIGALGYFGVFDASRFVPDSCKLDGTIECQAFAVDENSVALEIRNNLNDDITVNEITLREQEDSTTYNVTLGSPVVINRRSSLSVIDDIAAGTLASFVGEKKNFDLEVRYERGGSGFNQTSTGSLTTTVQPNGQVN